uniref:alpha-L-fucosidase n=1 Tax=Ciona intestinalis TaxID=7719 RepID=F6PLF9_CIOIN|nr:alpha-L-fucosidase [Ciona intestinalis]|eukprot:XP_002127716.1 alpha-L-fucosidase [Ciona intestinalis]
MLHHIILCSFLFLLCGQASECKSDIKAGNYLPNWDSLDKRPLPVWYDEAKVGIFIHWGVFSVPSFVSEWFWWYWQGTKQADCVDFMENNYPPSFQYADFAPEFTTEFFNPNDWADLFKTSGAEYVVLTSKHHEGFTNWPSANSWNWNSVDVGPHRNLVKELADAVRNRTSIHFGLYHSLYEWFNPLYLKDKADGFKTQEFVSSKTMPELYDIVNNYKPDVLWSDGDWEASAEYWNSTNFLAWLYNQSPVKDTVVTNDRWGQGVMCKHGGYFTCSDRYNPGKLQPRKWENAMTLDKKSWGYRRNAELSDYLTIEELLQTLATTVSCGGNLLVNIGPSKDGTIHPIFEERLKQMGEWLNVNGEAVYKSQPWKHQNDSLTPGVWYTTNQNKVYAFVFTWPTYGLLNLGSPVATSDASSVKLLGEESSLTWEPLKSAGVGIYLPVINPSTTNAKWLYVLQLTGFV